MQGNVVHRYTSIDDAACLDWTVMQASLLSQTPPTPFENSNATLHAVSRLALRMGVQSARRSIGLVHHWQQQPRLSRVSGIPWGKKLKLCIQTLGLN
jgi:hypothetical protein